MANPNNVELEAAKFLHKLIQDSTDEPTKLATKLYVILQHMRSSGKENSMPYQVISRAMDTVINQHNLDIESLMSSRLPMTSGTHVGESSSPQLAGSSQRLGVTNDSKASLVGNEMAKFDVQLPNRSFVGVSNVGQDAYPVATSHLTGVASKIHGAPPSSSNLNPIAESGVSNPMQFGSSPYDNYGSLAKVNKDRSMETYPAMPSGDLSASRKGYQHEGGNPNPYKMFQGGGPNSAPEMGLLRNRTPRDSGKSPISHANISSMPFKEQHLKQLRAQCLVFLAFRNGMAPKKLHLDIALGNFSPKEDGSRKEPHDPRGKDQFDDARDVARIPSGPSSSRNHADANSLKETEKPSMMEGKIAESASFPEHAEERRHCAGIRKIDDEIPTKEKTESQVYKALQSDFSLKGMPSKNHEVDMVKSHGQIMSQSSSVSVPKQTNPEVMNWNGSNNAGDSKLLPAASALLPESVPEIMDNTLVQSQSLGDDHVQVNQHDDSQLPRVALKEHWKFISQVDGQQYAMMPGKDSSIMQKKNSLDSQKTVPVEDISQSSNPFISMEADHEGEDFSVSTDISPSPKYSTSEKWILDQQKRKLLTKQSWVVKQRKMEQRIAECSGKLKENVNSSEDISAKTKSVIELKKLQLLELQRRLRSDILNDFFKPIVSEMDRLKSQKKHRIGRKSKQLERYEQKMKEERQRRIRERQKEFFSDIEVHRERLEDVFKMRRERWKGFNRYVREFHKRRERIHREKIDRIQREKINLLKINDVEGYLRMVQDAKSGRVKQLLKETETYLQKLGEKLREAKDMTKQFESDMDENRDASIVEKNEISFENEDETDQAKHYLESNEKYYMMAHSVKETVAEQPSCLVGGKLREYQMNGLRWLVSLYNNHLNGILADEMGLGKTVQVISLMCYLMETKNDRGPFLVVVPSSVLSGWESELSFWAPSVHRIVYSGLPEERRRLFREQIVHQKFNVLLTTYEYLMNKHDRPKLSKVHWHYIIIDEGHRIKNASCKLNADLKHYRSNHRLLLTGTPLQNNLEELWALLNFLLPNIFNSSEDFSQWFNKPFESNGDNSADEALLSEEENLLIINRLHQVLRPFVLRRLKHKVENELPEKIERLIRCEASAYQKLLMKRVEENLGAIGSSKARSVHNSVMELRNICNHPYLSQLHVEEVHDLIPKHYLPNIVRLCGKLEMLDRLLPKLKATDHRVLLFSTMTRLLDVMEDYLCWKQYKYLRLDGHTSGGERGTLIDLFNQPGSPFFIFLLSIRAGGVGVNLQAADTVIIFDTDWNPQVDLQAQARAHRIGQKKDVLVLRLETVQTVEEQVRASAEHKLGVANQSITAGFFDNNTSAEDRREYLESLLRECKKEEVAPVLDDDALNDLIARSEPEIDIFESVDKQRHEREMAAWKELGLGCHTDNAEHMASLPSRLLTEEDLKPFYEAMKISEVTNPAVVSNAKRKSGYLGGLDTQHYGRGKRAREVRSYEEQWTEEEFEKMCQVDSPDSPKLKEEDVGKISISTDETSVLPVEKEAPTPPVQLPPMEQPTLQAKEITPPSKRGRGRPKRVTVESSPSALVLPASSSFAKMDIGSQKAAVSQPMLVTNSDSLPSSASVSSISGTFSQLGVHIAPPSQSNPTPPPFDTSFQSSTASFPPVPVQGRGRGRKTQSSMEVPRRRGKKMTTMPPVLPVCPAPSTAKFDIETIGAPDSVPNSTAMNSVSPVVLVPPLSFGTESDMGPQRHLIPSSVIPSSQIVVGTARAADKPTVGTASSHQIPSLPLSAFVTQSILPPGATPKPVKARGRRAQSEVRAPRGRGRKRDFIAVGTPSDASDQNSKGGETVRKKSRMSINTTSPGVNTSSVSNEKLMDSSMDHNPEGLPKKQENNAVPDDIPFSKAQVSSQETLIVEKSPSSLSVVEIEHQHLRGANSKNDLEKKDEKRQEVEGYLTDGTAPTMTDLNEDVNKEKLISPLSFLEVAGSASELALGKSKDHQTGVDDANKKNYEANLHGAPVRESKFTASESSAPRSVLSVPPLHAPDSLAIPGTLKCMDTNDNRESPSSKNGLEQEIPEKLVSTSSFIEIAVHGAELESNLMMDSSSVESPNEQKEKTPPDEVFDLNGDTIKQFSSDATAPSLDLSACNSGDKSEEKNYQDMVSQAAERTLDHAIHEPKDLKLELIADGPSEKDSSLIISEVSASSIPFKNEMEDKSENIYAKQQYAGSSLVETEEAKSKELSPECESHSFGNTGSSENTSDNKDVKQQCDKSEEKDASQQIGGLFQGRTANFGYTYKEKDTVPQLCGPSDVTIAPKCDFADIGSSDDTMAPNCGLADNEGLFRAAVSDTECALNPSMKESDQHGVQVVEEENSVCIETRVLITKPESTNCESLEGDPLLASKEACSSSNLQPEIVENISEGNIGNVGERQQSNDHFPDSISLSKSFMNENKAVDDREKNMASVLPSVEIMAPVFVSSDSEIVKEIGETIQKTVHLSTSEATQDDGHDPNNATRDEADVSRFVAVIQDEGHLSEPEPVQDETHVCKSAATQTKALAAECEVIQSEVHVFGSEATQAVVHLADLKMTMTVSASLEERQPSSNSETAVTMLEMTVDKSKTTSEHDDKERMEIIGGVVVDGMPFSGIDASGIEISRMAASTSSSMGQGVPVEPASEKGGEIEATVNDASPKI